MKNLHHPLLLTASLLLACGSAQTPRALEDPGAFERLTAIAGTWQTTSEGGTTTADYALLSRGTALVETWTGTSGARTLTVYHPDGDTVRLTHYCAQGNQARLRLTEASATRFRFEREDVTNLLPDHSVLSILILSIENGQLVRTETYVDSHGVPETESVLRFDRVPPG